MPSSVSQIITSSASLSAAIGDGTGSNKVVFSTAPTLDAGSASAASWPKMSSGTVLTSPEAGAMEWDGNAWYHTSNTTEGRRATRDCAIFRLTADGGGIGPTIADYFGSGSAYPTIANAIYLITCELWFVKTTNGTATFNLLNSQSYANICGYFVQTPAAGLSSVGNAGTAGVSNTTSASGPLPASPSLSNAATHHFSLRFLAEIGTAGTIKLQVTQGAGSMTQQRGSFMMVERLPSGNVGAWQ